MWRIIKISFSIFIINNVWSYDCTYYKAIAPHSKTINIVEHFGFDTSSPDNRDAVICLNDFINNENGDGDTEPGAHIFIPEGTYLTSKDFRIYTSNIEISGTGNSIIKRVYGSYENATIKFTSGHPDLIYNDPDACNTWNYLENIKIEDLIIDNSAFDYNSIDEHNHGIQFVGVMNFTIKNLNIINTKGDGIYIAGSKNGNVEGNYIYNFGELRNGIAIVSGKNINLKSNKINGNNNGAIGIDLEPSSFVGCSGLAVNHNQYSLKNIIISENFISGINRGIAINPMATAEDADIEDIKINNNTIDQIDNIENYGIICRRNSSGSSTKKLKKITIEGNSILSSNSPGIYFDRIDESIIGGNHINSNYMGTNKEAIFISRSENIIIKKNLISDFQDGFSINGTSIEKTKNITIVSNQFADLEYGIKFEQPNSDGGFISNVILNSNTFTNIDKWAIVIKGTSNPYNCTRFSISNNIVEINDPTLFGFINFNPGRTEYVSITSNNTNGKISFNKYQNNTTLRYATISGNIGLSNNAGSVELETDYTTSEQGGIYTDIFTKPSGVKPSFKNDNGTKGEMVYKDGFVYICIGNNDWVKLSADNNF